MRALWARRLDISYDSATPIGMKVWAEAEPSALDGRRLVFSVAALDEAGQIGQGLHEALYRHVFKVYGKLG